MTTSKPEKRDAVVEPVNDEAAPPAVYGPEGGCYGDGCVYEPSDPTAYPPPPKEVT